MRPTESIAEPALDARFGVIVQGAELNIVVTGGAGFIGSWLCERLAAAGAAVTVVDDLSTGNGANVELLIDAGCDVHVLDVTSPDFDRLVRSARPEVIYHLAAQTDIRRSITDPRRDMDTCIQGALSMCEAALRAGTRKVVFASSGAVYGEPDWLPIGESAAQRPMSPYGVGKKAVADFLQYYRSQRGLDFTALVLANVYGPRQRVAGGVVATMASRMLADQEVVIYGSGQQTRDFVYVDDAVDALIAAATRGDGLSLNIGTGKPTSIHQLFDRLAAVTGYTRRPTHAPARLGEPVRCVLDNRAAGMNMGWRPTTRLDAGLRATIDAGSPAILRAA